MSWSATFLVASVAAAADRLNVVVCEEPEACEADAARFQATAGDAGLETVLLDVVLELDAGGWVDGRDERARFTRAVDRAREETEKGHWAKAGEAGAEALDALERWPGTVGADDLFTAWFALGAWELARGEDASWQRSFRQAIAAAAGPGTALPEVPAADTRIARAFADEVRKAVVAGRGDLVVDDLPADAALSVDGHPVAPRAGAVSLLPGTHRVTVARRGSLATFEAAVPVLAERVTTVRYVRDEADDLVWVRERLEGAFDTLTAPESVSLRLADWCGRRGLAEIRLVRVERTTVARDVTDVTVGDAPPTRPEAAAGPRVDLGDGVPATIEDDALAGLEDRSLPRPHDVARVRIIWFDPVTRRFRADSGGQAVAAERRQARFRIGMRGGYSAMMDRHHGALDLDLAARAGPVLATVQLGLVRADTSYNLYRDWTDRVLYHAFAGARWAPDLRLVAPFLSAGPEMIVPVTLGARLNAGVEGALGPAWVGAFEAHGSALTRGAGWGVGLGLSRQY